MIHIKNAQFSDCTAIAQLHADNWQRHYRGIYSDYFLDHEVENDRLQLWQGRLATPKDSQQILVAVNDYSIIGLACFFLDDHPQFGAYLDNLHVSKAVQGTGIGKKLMQECAQRILAQAENKGLYLWVFEANHNARKVYDSWGGQNFETVQREIEDGTKALICRYIWPDVSLFLIQK